MTTEPCLQMIGHIDLFQANTPLLYPLNPFVPNGFLSVAYLTVVNLARLGNSVHCLVSVRPQYLVRLLSLCWITGGYIIHPPIEGLLSPTGTESTPFRNSASNVAGLQVHNTTPGYYYYPLKTSENVAVF